MAKKIRRLPHSIPDGLAAKPQVGSPPGFPIVFAKNPAHISGDEGARQRMSASRRDRQKSAPASDELAVAELSEAN